MLSNPELFTMIVLISGFVFLAGMLVEGAWVVVGHKWSRKTEMALFRFRIVSLVQMLLVIGIAWFLH